jgi:hypothetical protein
MEACQFESLKKRLDTIIGLLEKLVDEAMQPAATKEMWLDGGQFYCDDHSRGIPFHFAPFDAVCAECTKNSPLSYLNIGVD